jgi:phosphoribosylcarboxyaminoimidazole (NCAIR) mutase
LAAQILALKYDILKHKLYEHKEEMKKKVEEKDKNIKEEA